MIDFFSIYKVYFYYIYLDSVSIIDIGKDIALSNIYVSILNIAMKHNVIILILTYLLTYLYPLHRILNRVKDCRSF